MANVESTHLELGYPMWHSDMPPFSIAPKGHTQMEHPFMYSPDGCAVYHLACTV